MEQMCPIARTAALIGDVYVLLILRDLANGPRRFSALQESVQVNPRTLSSRLRRLEEKKIIARTQYAEIPPRVEYALTDKGRALLPIIEHMRAYGEQWLAGTDDEAPPHTSPGGEKAQPGG